MQTARPVFRIGAAGLDPRDWRLIEIVFKHSQYNRFEFVLTEGANPNSIDILIANTNDPQGVRAVSAVRGGTRSVPVIAAMPRGSPGAARHAISIDRLTLQLLPILNRVVELELLVKDGETASGVAHPAPIPSAVVRTPSSPSVVAPRAATAPPATAPIVARAASAPSAAFPSGSTVSETLVGASAVVSVPSAVVAARSAVGAASFAAASVSVEAPTSGTISRSRSSASAAAAPDGQALEAGSSPGSASRQAEARASGPDLLPDQGSPSYSLSPPAPTPLRALVVDDSPTVRQQLMGALGRMGLTTDVAQNARQALEALQDQYYDIILVDVVMPDMDGYKLTREIKRNKQYRQIPVVMLTSRSSPFDLARGALAGCDSYLTKPVPLQALEKTLLKQLRKSLAIDDLSAMLRPVLVDKPPAQAPTAASGAPLPSVARAGTEPASVQPRGLATVTPLVRHG